jgi:hypothetical protein
MKKILGMVVFAVLGLGIQARALALDATPAAAATSDAGSCEAKAVGKDGKKLAGAAKTSFMKKCEAEAKPACEEKAVDKNGKKLAGAAKTSFMKKCEAEGK